VDGCSSKSLVKFLATVPKEDAARDAFRLGVKRRFANVLSSAGRSPVDNVADLARALASFGMRGTATKALAGVLPHDKEALAYLLARSPNTFAKYLYLCRQSDPELFSASASGDKLDIVEHRLARLIKTRGTSLSNICGILKSFPVSFRTRVVLLFKDELTAWAGDLVASDAVPLVELFLTCRVDTESLVLAIAAQVPHGSSEAFGSLPLRLKHFGLLDHDACLPIVGRILARAEVDADPASAQRVLWDLMCFSEKSADSAATVAERTLADERMVADAWNVLALTGALAMVGRESPAMELTLPPAVVLTADRFAEKDRYQLARVLIGAAELWPNTPIPPAIARQFLARARDSATSGISKSLISRAVALAQHSAGES
jgi:hypothetical protein